MILPGSIHPSTAIKWPQIDFKGLAYKKVEYIKEDIILSALASSKKCHHRTAKAKQKERRSRGAIISPAANSSNLLHGIPHQEVRALVCPLPILA